MMVAARSDAPLIRRLPKPRGRLPADAPTLHVRGVAYKGTIDTRTRPPER